MLRVIHRATGNVGRHAAAVHRHPGLELVGALAFLDLPVITGRGVPV